jgi:RNA polymerase sigma-70 factor (sigma-E family)
MRAEHEREFAEFAAARVLMLRRTAYRLCGDWHRAEDLAQNALIRLYRHWANARAADSLDAYARRTLVNAYLDDQRRWWARRVTPVAEPDPRGGSAVPVDQSQDQRLDLVAALARLAPRQRAVLVLRYWEGLDVAATAAALGCAEGTVKSQTSDAIAALRRLLPGYVSERLVSGGRESS